MTAVADMIVDKSYKVTYRDEQADKITSSTGFFLRHGKFLGSDIVVIQRSEWSTELDGFINHEHWIAAELITKVTRVEQSYKTNRWITLGKYNEEMREFADRNEVDWTDET
jgi:hypothetical protein